MTKELERIIRVNQAGEYGAKRIYKGQLAVLKGNQEIEKMLKSELRHLEYFDEQVKKRKVRPTALQPLWHIGGFAMGSICALMGEKAAMACTVAVEEVIGDHYGEQLKSLKKIKDEESLALNIEEFMHEELEHRDIGLDHDAEKSFGYEGLKAIIKTITKTAIFLSKRI
ncbi:MAG: demethoxyubiquinone hydroxylase family protein [Candidatus Jidaibacter sp.]|nr:demethoxyubiquinone hydroxylase family protein [Candidatus Jidaibacter sp.]